MIPIIVVSARDALGNQERLLRQAQRSTFKSPQITLSSWQLSGKRSVSPNSLATLVSRGNWKLLVGVT
ncbi:MAG: hypothetical protein WDM77_11535 [Steroidobacteraceae bacterium]